jgi:hypothetical protein
VTVTRRAVVCRGSFCRVLACFRPCICVREQILCTAPSQFGLNHSVTVSAGGQTSNVALINYARPVISSVTPNVGDAVNGEAVIIKGRNFGLLVLGSESQPIAIYVDDKPCIDIIFVRDSEVCSCVVHSRRCLYSQRCVPRLVLCACLTAGAVQDGIARDRWVEERHCAHVEPRHRERFVDSSSVRSDDNDAVVPYWFLRSRERGPSPSVL